MFMWWFYILQHMSFVYHLLAFTDNFFISLTQKGICISDKPSCCHKYRYFGQPRISRLVHPFTLCVAFVLRCHEWTRNSHKPLAETLSAFKCHPSSLMCPWCSHFTNSKYGNIMKSEECFRNLGHSNLLKLYQCSLNKPFWYLKGSLDM